MPAKTSAIFAALTLYPIAAWQTQAVFAQDDQPEPSYLADGTLASYKMILDLVVFGDGSSFGPKKSSESYEVLGMIQGIDDVKRTTEEAPANEQR
jgi:hypothetical protein